MGDTRSEAHRFAGVLILAQLAQHVPNLIFAKRKTLFNPLWDVLSDRNPVVRTAAATALEFSLQVISQRESMSEYIRSAVRQVDTGVSSNNSEKVIGGLIILDTVLGGSVVSLSELHTILKDQVQDLIWKVMQKKDFRDAEVKRKILDLIPKVAGAFNNAFIQTNPYMGENTFLMFSLKHIIDTINAKRDRPTAFLSLGKLFQAVSSFFRNYSAVGESYDAVSSGFRDPFCLEALSCLGMMVTYCPAVRKYIDERTVDLMFRGKLSLELVESLKVVIRHIPTVRGYAQRMLRESIQSILSVHVVQLDEVTSRPISIKLGGKAVGSPQTTPSRDQKSGYLWSSTASSLFGSSSSGASAQAARADGMMMDNGNRTQSGVGNDQLIFALRVLSMPDFFPKQQRDRAISSGEEDQTRDLLAIVRDLVLRYMDDYNVAIRKSAAQACASVIDIILPGVEPQSPEFYFIYQILDRLLIMGVGDDSSEIRTLVFNSVTPSMDMALSMTDNVHCLIEALNDEVLVVRAAAMTVLSRVAHYDELHVMPVVRLTLKRLISSLSTTRDLLAKQESVHILQALVRGSDSLIIPYVKQIITPLMALLNESNTDVVISALSTVGELALASPASVCEHLDEIAPRLIEALNDQSSSIKQKTAVIALGKLVSSLTMVTDEPFKRFSGLFDGLVKAMQSADDSGVGGELRLQAIKTLGLLGVADFSVHQKYLSTSVGSIAVHTDDVFDEDDPVDGINTSGADREKPMTKIEKYFFSVVIRSLMNVLRDSSLNYYHSTASSIAIRAFRLVGPNAVIQLPELMSGILFRLHQGDAGNNIKEALLDHIISLVQIMGKAMRRYISALLHILVQFFDTHLQLTLDVFEALSGSLPTPDFHLVLQGFLPCLYRAIEAECGRDETLYSEEGTPTGDDSSSSSRDNNNMSGFLKQSTVSTSGAKLSTAMAAPPQSNKSILSPATVASAPLYARTSKILQKLVNIGDVLSEYRKDIIPMIIKILDQPSISPEIRKEALSAVMNLANDSDLQEFTGRIVHSLLRFMMVAEGSILGAIFTALSSLICRLGTGFVPYIIPVRRKTKTLSLREGFVKSTKMEEYESFVGRLLKERPLPKEPNEMNDIAYQVDNRVRGRASTSRLAPETNFHISIQSLETAWALADRNNATNLVDWMRRLMIELIRQSPSPLIRLCATLAKTHRPLAEELFNASFYSIWDELYSMHVNDVIIDIPLINGIEMALQSPQIPKNIMHSLLNLIEFMEIQDKPLPVDVVLIARQAQAANMFAKSLRYREMEFASKNIAPSFTCIDALITVNNQLGLSDRAIGILRSVSQQYQNIDIQPQWLEKLCRWDDAHKAYEVEIRSIRECRSDGDSSPKGEKWMQYELGRLRCLRAVADYEQLEQNARSLKDEIKQLEEELHESTLQEVQCLGAKAAWMLGKWDLMEDFLGGDVKAADGSSDVLLEQNCTFFQAILAVHQRDYSKASSLISETRSALSGNFTSLMSESYSRAYRAMVSMQILAELDEVVEFKQLEEKVSVDMDALIANNNEGDSAATMQRLLSLEVGNNNNNSGDGKSGVSALTNDILGKKVDLVRKWRARLKWAPRDIEVYRQILAVHTLVADPQEDLDSWIELVTLCRKEGMFTLCSNILRKLGAPIPYEGTMIAATANAAASDTDFFTEAMAKVNERVLFSTCQYWWSNGEKHKALEQLNGFLNSCAVPSNLSTVTHQYSHQETTSFRVKCLLKCATWMRELEEGDVQNMLRILRAARDLAKDEYSVWHAWAVANFDQLKKADSKKKTGENDVLSTPPVISTLNNNAQPRSSITSFLSPPSGRKNSSAVTKLTNYLTPKKLNQSNASSTLISMVQADKATTFFVTEAIQGFVRSITLGQGQPVANLLQDTLRLITLWFSYGSKIGVSAILETELEKVSPVNWLGVIPQLIARIHIKTPEISILLRKLLNRVAAAHPQALVCPISVAMNTNDNQQQYVATEVLQEMRKNCKELVDEATMVSRELMKVAVTPYELWYDGLEQAAQCYMDNKDIPSMLVILKDLHDTMSEQGQQSERNNKRAVGLEGFTENLGKIGVSSLRDVSFRYNYSKALQDAQFWLDQFKVSGKTIDLHQAWEIYQAIFKKIKGLISALKKIELHHVSMALTSASDLSLAVPGTYKPGAVDVCISGFSPTVHVITSKQRPRRMSIFGSDGRRYQFLLKGHEDLRQDERVMQLFGLINVCLEQDPITSDRGLNIVRYSVLPLSNNSGLIGWVENCDTINSLVKTYRESKDIRLLIEVKLLQAKSLNYDKLPLLQKVEIFRQVLYETTGEDLAKMLWLKSKTSDVWIERRASFTKSLAVMSMAGYILGLGDRHPSNLMVDRFSGQVVHIDFGDCFEITKHRSKYPEIIPFRLTRMLTNCMEAAGIQGTYKLTSERVMRVLRDNRDSLMAMLEAFVYDPLISWRLLATKTETSETVSRVNSDEIGGQRSPVDQVGASSIMKASDISAAMGVSVEIGAASLAVSPKRAPPIANSMRDVEVLRRTMSKDTNAMEGAEPLQENLNAR